MCHGIPVARVSTGTDKRAARVRQVAVREQVAKRVQAFARWARICSGSRLSKSISIGPRFHVVPRATIERCAHDDLAGGHAASWLRSIQVELCRSWHAPVRRSRIRIDIHHRRVESCVRVPTTVEVIGHHVDPINDVGNCRGVDVCNVSVSCWRSDGQVVRLSIER